MTPGQLSPVHISNISHLPHRYTISPEEIRYNQAVLQKKLPASPCPARRYNTRFPVLSVIPVKYLGFTQL